MPIVLAGEYSTIQRLIGKLHGIWAHSIGYRCEISPLKKPEISAIIRHRLSAAGCASTNPFSHAVIERIADYANGVPGTINSLCRLALFFASERKETRVSVEAIELAASAALLNKEPLGDSRMALPQHSQSERCNDSEEAVTTGISAAATLALTIQLLRRFLPNDTPTRLFFHLSSRLRQKSHEMIQFLLVSGALLLLLPGLWQVRSSVMVPAKMQGDPEQTIMTQEIQESSVGLNSRLAATTDVTANENVPTTAVAVSSTASARAVASPEAQTDSALLGPDQPESLAADESETSRLLALAEDHVKADRLMAPRFDNALAVYRKILRANPENQAALDGLASIKEKILSYAKMEAERGDSAGALRQLKKMQWIDKKRTTATGPTIQVTGKLDEPRQSAQRVFLSDR
jgi:hypothetical protein